MYDHYKQGAIPVEPIVVCSRMSFCLGNFVKYVCRAPYKGTEVEDLEKALWYIDHINFNDLDEEVKQLQKDKVLCEVLSYGPAILKNLLLNVCKHDIKGLIELALNKRINELLVTENDEQHN